MSSSNRSTSQKSAAYGAGNKAEAFAAGVKYDANQYYLAAIYSETRHLTPVSGTNRLNGEKVSGAANRASDIELVAQYQFDNGLRPSLGYVQTQGKQLENGIGNTPLVKYIDVGATYYFNKNMSAFLDYKINQISKDNRLALNSDDIVAVGLTYQF